MKTDPDTLCTTVPQNIFWAIVHDLIAHPLLVLLFYSKLATRFHDYTSARAWPRADRKNKRTVEELEEGIKKFLLADGNDLCHENRKELGTLIGMENPPYPTLPKENEYALNCIKYRKTCYGYDMGDHDDVTMLENEIERLTTMLAMARANQGDSPKAENVQQTIRMEATQLSADAPSEDLVQLYENMADLAIADSRDVTFGPYVIKSLINLLKQHRTGAISKEQKDA